MTNWNWGLERDEDWEDIDDLLLWESLLLEDEDIPSWQNVVEKVEEAGGTEAAIKAAIPSLYQLLLQIRRDLEEMMRSPLAEETKLRGSPAKAVQRLRAALSDLDEMIQ